jgi:prepilin-type processing-associated H-X9-DG protein
MSDFSGAASPANIWVFVDEDQFSLNDGGFAVNMNTPEWIDFVGTYHNFGGGFAFADGHSEIHKWKDGKTKPPMPIARTPVVNRIDWQWMVDHTSSR